MDLLYCFEINAFIWWVALGEVLEMFPIASCVIFPITEHLIKLLFFQSVIPSLSASLWYEILQKSDTSQLSEFFPGRILNWIYVALWYKGQYQELQTNITDRGISIFKIKCILLFKLLVGVAGNAYVTKLLLLQKHLVLVANNFPKEFQKKNHFIKKTPTIKNQTSFFWC